MRYFLVSFAFTGGYGRRLFGTDVPIDEKQILFWEDECAKGVRGSTRPVSILAISEIDGPVKPVSRETASEE